MDAGMREAIPMASATGTPQATMNRTAWSIIGMLSATVPSCRWAWWS